MSRALALKYRPQRFSDLIGQDAISQTLSLALELDKVSHGYLFSGLQGSGKTSSARIFARALQCKNYPTSTPCGECESCLAAADESHSDIIEIDAASTGGKDDINDLIEQTHYRPAFGRFKIFIIDEVHMLSNSAFNALLKTLEEPPECVKFILATTDPMKLPPTILSRVQHFRFKKIPQSTIATHLKRILGLEGVAFEESAIDLLARNCGGSMRDSLTLLESIIVFSKSNITLDSVTSALGAVNPSVVEEFFAAILAKDEARIDALLADFAQFEAENVLSEMVAFLKNRLEARDSRFPAPLVERFWRVLGEAKNMLSLNAEGDFVLLLSALRLKECLNIEEIDRLIAKMEAEILGESCEALTQQNGANPANLPVLQTPASQDSPRQDSPKDSAKTPPPSPPTPPPPSPAPSPEARFAKLVAKIFERDYALGEIFEKSYRFVSFENGVLTWESLANEKQRAALKPYGGVISGFVREIFGKSVKVAAAEKAEQKEGADSPLDAMDSPRDSGDSPLLGAQDSTPSPTKFPQDSMADSQDSPKVSQRDSTLEPPVIKDIESVFSITQKIVKHK